MTSSGAEALKASVRRSLPIIIGLVLLAIAAVNVFKVIQGPRYEGTARVLISTRPLSSIITNTDPGFVDPQRIQETALVIAKSQRVYALAADQSDEQFGGPDALDSATEVAADPNTELIKFTAESSNPDNPVGIVNTAAKAYTDLRPRVTNSQIKETIEALRESLSTLPPESREHDDLRKLNKFEVLRQNARDAELIQPAASAKKVSPSPLRDSLLGLSLGLIVVLLVVGLRAVLDTRVRSEADAEGLLSAPVLASVRSLPRRTLVLRTRLTGAEVAISVLGGAVTVLAAYASVHVGAEFGVGLLLVVGLVIGTVIGFIAYPHVAVAATIVLFAFVPVLRLFVSAEIGAVKDFVVLAAVLAAVLLYVLERRSPDRPALILVLLLLALYVVNFGGTHGLAWAHGVRLVAEPLLLLLVGLTLPDPRRTFRFALGALVLTASLVATYGIVQQLAGEWTLVGWGYGWNEQVRLSSGGLLRSFGTLDDPFAYAALLLFGLVAILFWLRRGPLAWSAAVLFLVGLAASFVQTAALILAALGGLLLSRWGRMVPAVLMVAAIAVAGGAILANAGGTETPTYPASASGGKMASSSTQTTAAGDVTLNDRISAWEAALGDNPADWVLGRGVGEVGTAAARATYTITPSSETIYESQKLAVDSGYFATIADVGFVGLALLIALFGWLIAVAASAARRGSSAGWVALGLITVLLLDALTRESFTGFPTALLGLFLIGIAIAAGREESASPPAPVQETAG
jgi:capsular polysaccharide biosynthesis protein/O-antigen ligase